MDDFNININSLIMLLKLLGFQILYEPDSNGLQKLGPKEIQLVNNIYKIRLEQIEESNGNQPESLVIPTLKERNMKLIHEKLNVILDLISGESSSENTNAEARSLRRGSSINVSKSFIVHHNVVVNMETSDVCTTTPPRCSSPVVSRPVQTPSRIMNTSMNMTEILLKARNLVDLAMDMSTKLNIASAEMGLNSTFTKDQTEENIRLEAPRISNIIKVSPLGDSKCGDSFAHLLDITNTTNANQAPPPKKLATPSNKLHTPKERIENGSIEKKWKRPFTKIGILKQPSKASGVTSNRNSPLGLLKENRSDTPRPIGAGRCNSANNLSSPYLRLTPRSTASNNSNISSINTPSPKYLRAPDGKLTPGSASALRKPGWCVKK